MIFLLTILHNKLIKCKYMSEIEGFDGIQGYNQDGLEGLNKLGSSLNYRAYQDNFDYIKDKGNNDFKDNLIKLHKDELFKIKSNIVGYPVHKVLMLFYQGFTVIETKQLSLNIEHCAFVTQDDTKKAYLNIIEELKLNNIINCKIGDDLCNNYLFKKIIHLESRKSKFLLAKSGEVNPLSYKYRKKIKYNEEKEKVLNYKKDTEDLISKMLDNLNLKSNDS